VKQEKNRLIAASVIPAFLVILMWVVRLAESSFGIDLGFLGVHPLHADGLPGIVLAPFVHEGFKHLSANTVPFFVLGVALFYFYRDLALKVLIFIWFMTGIWVWFGGRDAWHIGASGIIYGMASFLFFSGLIRKNTGLAALALVVVFLYGSLIWGAIPGFFPKSEHLSWESHLGGLFSGFVITLYYRKSGPQRKKYSWELEEEDDDDTDAYWKKPDTT
jgi:membrane associated rhomboid family serine protease